MVGIFVTVHSLRSNGDKICGTRLTVPDGTKKCGTGTIIINFFI